MKSFSGIILAAGKGNRLNNYNKPKSTLELKKNYTLLDKIISNFKKNKIKKLFIITGYKENYLKKYNIKKIFNKNWKNTNMLKSLLCADKILKKNDCIVSYSDIFYDESAIRLLKKQKSDGYEVAKINSATRNIIFATHPSTKDRINALKKIM